MKRFRLGRANKNNPTGNGTINALQALYSDHEARELAEDDKMRALIEQMKDFEGTGLQSRLGGQDGEEPTDEE